jgi:hypothetical protein
MKRTIKSPIIQSLSLAVLASSAFVGPALADWEDEGRVEYIVMEKSGMAVYLQAQTNGYHAIATWDATNGPGAIDKMWYVTLLAAKISNQTVRITYTDPCISIFAGNGNGTEYHGCTLKDVIVK